MTRLPSENLRIARAKLQDGHWIQRFYGRLKELEEGEPPQPCYCLAGAIGSATGGPASQSYTTGAKELALVRRAIAEKHPSFDAGPVGAWYGSAINNEAVIIRYNDVFGRTEQEVLAVLDKAIEIAEQEEYDS